MFVHGTCGYEKNRIACGCSDTSLGVRRLDCRFLAIINAKTEQQSPKNISRPQHQLQIPFHIPHITSKMVKKRNRDLEVLEDAPPAQSHTGDNDSGSDDVSKVDMRVTDGGKSYQGYGFSTDIVRASANAYLDALNKFV